MISAQASSGGAVQSGMLWWKVELDKSGAILTCERVDDVSKGSKLVAYVQATTKAGACSEVKLWWAARKASNRAHERAKIARFLSQGLCSCCGKKPLATKYRCRQCADRSQQRKVERAQGRPLLSPLPHQSAEQAREAARTSKRVKKSRHPECYTTFARLWDRLREMGAEDFEHWLIESMSQFERDERGLSLAEAAE